MIVRPAETSSENQDVVILQLDSGSPSISVNDFVDVNPVGFGTGQFESVIRFVLAVQSKPGEHQGFHRDHINPPKREFQLFFRSNTSSSMISSPFPCCTLKRWVSVTIP